RIQDSNEAIQKAALDALVKEIRSSTSSMTSVPKPLKFLKPHYEKIKQIHEKYPSNSNKVLCCFVWLLVRLFLYLHFCSGRVGEFRFILFFDFHFSFSNFSH